MNFEQLEDRHLLTTFVVDSSHDLVDGDTTAGNLTLREAVSLANANPGYDDIRFDESLDGETIELELGELVVEGHLRIFGEGKITIDAQHLSRAFDLSKSERVLLQDFEIENGYSASDGGAVLSGEFLKAANMVFSNNSAALEGGAIAGLENATVHIRRSAFTDNVAWRGGAVFVHGTHSRLGLSDSQFERNHAEEAGGALMLWGGSHKVRDSSFIKNTSLNTGGAIETNSGRLVLMRSHIIDNEAEGFGGGLAVSKSKLSIIDTIIEKNHADGGGGIFSRNDSQTHLTRTHVVMNTSNSHEAGIMSHDWFFALLDSVVTDNMVGDEEINVTDNYVLLGRHQL